MEKIIKYKFLSSEQTILDIAMPWSEANEEIAKLEALDGQYTVDGVEKTAAEQILEFKEQLLATDYKVVKCAECQLLNKEMPYDVAELHAERQAIRDAINSLEQEA